MPRILLAALTAACAGKHATFVLPSTTADAPEETRLFLDARGDLYPRSGVRADYVLPDRAEGSLFEAARGTDPALCAQPQAASELDHLCAAVSGDCRGDATPACFARWRGAQAELWQRRSAAVLAHAPAGEAVTIAVLIHGFNNWYRESSTSFAAAEKQLRRFNPAGERLQVVAVYWDGCRGSGQGVDCWGPAQSTGPLVGFALRQLFHHVEVGAGHAGIAPRWRLLTHSSGAFVAGALFADPTAALPQLAKPETNRWYGAFASHARATSGPHGVPQGNDIRLGMFAAATPDTTFIGNRDYPEGGVLSPHLRILTTLQPDDRGPNKAVVGCWRFGNSCLGVKRDHACDVRRTLAARTPAIPVTIYDFTRDPALWRDERTLHDFPVYIRQAADHSTFLRDLMAAGDGRGEGAGPLVECGLQTPGAA